MSDDPFGRSFPAIDVIFEEIARREGAARHYGCSWKANVSTGEFTHIAGYGCPGFHEDLELVK